MRIYTKKGDKGKTGLFDDSLSRKVRISKASVRIRALGSLDELNSYLGIVISESEDLELEKILRDIQADIMRIGSIVGGSNLYFFKQKLRKLERKIDELEESLPPLRNFILPGGSKIAAELHYVRSLARRAERAVVALNKKTSVKPQILSYLNRLSDMLFVLARSLNCKLGIKDEIWRSR